MNDDHVIIPRFRLEDLRLFPARGEDDAGRENCRHIFYISRAARVLELGATRFEAPALVFAAPGKGLDEIADLPASTRGLAIAFADDFFCMDQSDRELLFAGGLFPVHGRPLVRQLVDDEALDMGEILRLMEREFRGDAHRREELLRSYLRILLMKSAAPPENFSPDEKRLNEFHELLEGNFRRKHRTSDYADMLFVSAKCLNELTRKHLGRSPGEIIRERVMREARRLLESGDYNVAATARELGFQDPHYFSRFFKRNAGRPPADFLGGK